MPEGDFLNQCAETTLHRSYLAAGAICSLSTNSESLLEAASNTFQVSQTDLDQADLSLRFWVDNADLAQPPWPRPYVRGLSHLVFAGFDSRSSLLADLQTRRVIGRFSAAMAGDAAYWQTVIFPVLLSIVAASIGVVELHASCVSKEGAGMILAGPTRAGKSTLAMALTEAGFSLLSDDRVFCAQQDGGLSAWGLARPIKLRLEAAEWFEGLCGREPRDLQNGEHVFHCQPERRAAKCEPRLIVFLERAETAQFGEASFALTQIQARDARLRLEADLLTEDSDDVGQQDGPLGRLSSLPCYLLRYGGKPEVTAQRLAKTFGEICK